MRYEVVLVLESTHLNYTPVATRSAIGGSTILITIKPRAMFKNDIFVPVTNVRWSLIMRKVAGFFACFAGGLRPLKSIRLPTAYNMVSLWLDSTSRTICISCVYKKCNYIYYELVRTKWEERVSGFRKFRYNSPVLEPILEDTIFYYEDYHPKGK